LTTISPLYDNSHVSNNESVFVSLIRTEMMLAFIEFVVFGTSKLSCFWLNSIINAICPRKYNIMMLLTFLVEKLKFWHDISRISVWKQRVVRGGERQKCLWGCLSRVFLFNMQVGREESGNASLSYQITLINTAFNFPIFHRFMAARLHIFQSTKAPQIGTSSL
jgi:hypothetical protein